MIPLYLKFAITLLADPRLVSATETLVTVEAGGFAHRGPHTASSPWLGGALLTASRPAARETACDPARDPRSDAGTWARACTNNCVPGAGSSAGSFPTSPSTTFLVSRVGSVIFTSPETGWGPASKQRELSLASMSSSPGLLPLDPEPGAATGNRKTCSDPGPLHLGRDVTQHSLLDT